jgi:hypothetical protein
MISPQVSSGVRPLHIPTMPDSLLLRHFWLVFLALMLLNIAIWRRRLQKLVAAGRASEAEVGGFLRGTTIGVIIFALTGEAIVLATGWRSPTCVYGEPWSAPGAIATWTLQIGTWALLVWWLWAGRGAETLARLGPALGRGRVRDRPYTKRQMRVFGSLLLAIAATVAVLNVAEAPKPGPCIATSALTMR